MDRPLIDQSSNLYHEKTERYSLKSKAGLDAIEHYESSTPDKLSEQRAAIVRRLAERLRLAFEQASELEEKIKALAAASFFPLTRICGVNLITAGTLAAILGPGNRFASDAQLAAYAGGTPGDVLCRPGAPSP